MSRSYRKEIIEALKQHGKNTNIIEMDFKYLADKVGIKVSKVHEEFKDMNDVIHQASVEYWADHEKKSKKITQLKGEHALATLIRHDLNNIYYYIRDTPEFERKYPQHKIVQHVKDYIENSMPKYYFDILRMNTGLLPNSKMDIRVYAHFIVHSMFFCAMDMDAIKTLDPEEFKAPTRRIITLLFKQKTRSV